MVQKEENGFSVNGMHIDYNTARELYVLLEHEYHKEDIVNTINEKYGNEIGNSLPEDLISKVADYYSNSMDNGGDWVDYAEEAVQDNKKDIESAIAEIKAAASKSQKEYKEYDV